MRTLVIIPAYNEAESILAVVRSVERAGYDYLVVNDGSTDATEDVCRRNDLNMLSLPENLGIGGAVQAGHKYALEHGYDIDVQFDGDGQHDASCIDGLVATIEQGADLVIGSRFVGETRGGFRSTAMRRMGIRWLSGCIKLVARANVADPTSGFRASGKRAIALFCREYPIDYPEPESIVVAVKRGLVVKEVSAIMHERAGGVSSIRPLSSVYYMVKVTLAIIIRGTSRGKRRAC